MDSERSGWTVHRHDERPIEARAVLTLFAAEGWWPERTADTMGRALASGPAAGAWRVDRLVGFARIVTDGTFRAYLEDVIVDRSHRLDGVAGALVGALLEPLPAQVLVSVFCAPSLAPVYAGMGFAATKQTVLHRPAARA